MPASTPSAQRSPSGSIRANASSVSTSVSVARIAASDSALPARVPPMPPTSMSSSAIEASIRSDTSAVMPNAPAGMPPAIALPIVMKSGSRPCAPV